MTDHTTDSGSSQLTPSDPGKDVSPSQSQPEEGKDSAKPRGPQKSKFVEAVLELGRNWAVAVAIAAFGAASYHGEAVTGLWQYKSVMLYATMSFSLLWIAVAVYRFLDVVQVPVGGARQTIKIMAVLALLLVTGLGLVLQAASYADNSMLVGICSDYRSQPQSAAHKDPRCQKLYQARAEKERSYLGR
ncbi:hypothetical protein [Pseudoxanthomonas mexicana]|uniref:hypothetical protein n=1 Tax=Pseudoxanthomonas mexicana TaxID=128785 RepID=UPI0028A10716|nr:hypothetical protein [Pseudoxanthomonas mexicana]